MNAGTSVIHWRMASVAIVGAFRILKCAIRVERCSGSKWGEHMKYWTGYKGKKDQEIRKTGKHFVVFDYLDEGLVVVRPNTKKCEKLLKENDWDSYVYMIAPNAIEAVKKFDSAFLQWRAFVDNEK